jgi:hypothetical protein
MERQTMRGAGSRVELPYTGFEFRYEGYRHRYFSRIVRL